MAHSRNICIHQSKRLTLGQELDGNTTLRQRGHITRTTILGFRAEVPLMPDLPLFVVVRILQGFRAEVPLVPDLPFMFVVFICMCVSILRMQLQLLRL